jgi:hypothetical protein
VPTRDEHLAKLTHKEDGVPMEKRVFYTLTDAPSESLVTLRNSRLIGLLVKTLIDEGTLTEDQLDEILLEVSR